jgi:hypothetical protein
VEVRGIRWVGIETARVAEMRAFALDVLGLRPGEQDEDEFVELVTADGSRVELFGPAAAAETPWLFERNAVVAGFLVDDIRAASDELARNAGVELVGELRELPDGYAWQPFRAPDGRVYELVVDPAAR